MSHRNIKIPCIITVLYLTQHSGFENLTSVESAFLNYKPIVI